MWLMTQHGFFSIVKKDDAIHVRARVRGDLENLKRAARLRLPVHESPSADYRWRLLVDAAGLRAILATLADTLDYPNFKERIARRPDQRDKRGPYHGVWARLAMLQPPPMT